MEKIKLSKKQKEVINYMRKPGASLIYRPRTKRFYADYRQSLSSKECQPLQDYNLIKIEGTHYPDTFWDLTELGKTIEL